MKILRYILLFSSCLLLGISKVSADELTDCLVNSTKDTCELASDISVTGSINVVGTKTLLLGDYNVTSSFSAPVFNLAPGASLNVYAGSGSIVNNGVVFNVTGGTLTINGGSYYSANNAVILEEAGNVLVNYGNIRGATGIEIQGGTLSANGAGSAFVGLSNRFSTSGSVYNVVNGAGIAVVKGKTANPIIVNLNAGQYMGYYAFYEKDLGTGSNNVSVDINGGAFVTSYGTSSIGAESLTGFINGGSFTSRPGNFADFLAEGKELNGNVVVSKAYSIDIRNSANGSVATSVSSAKAGDVVSITITPDANYVIDSLKVYKVADDTEVTVLNNTFTMPSDDVYVVAKFKEKATPTIPPKNIVINSTEPSFDKPFGVDSSLLTDLTYRNAIAEIIKNNNNINDVELTIKTEDVTNNVKATYPNGIPVINSYVQRINNMAVIAKYYQVSMDINVEDLKSSVLNKNLAVNYKLIIPEEYKLENRKFYLIGYNGNNAYTALDNIDGKKDYLLFSSSALDMFALAYVDDTKPVDPEKPSIKPDDTNKPNNDSKPGIDVPNTYDDIYNYFYMNGFATLGLLSVYIIIKRKCR